MKVWIVTYDGTTRCDAIDIYLQGIYTSKERAEEESEKIEKEFRVASFIHEVALNSPLEIRHSEEDSMGSCATDVALGCYFE